MNARFRILQVVTRSPPRGLRFAGSEDWGLPVLDVVEDAARLLAAGAEVRVLDQDVEDLSGRAVRRQARLWQADLVLLHAGGTAVAANPVPDDRPLAALLAGWRGTGPVVACGPLAALHGEELLLRHARLAGALRGAAGGQFVGPWQPDAVPGLLTRQTECAAVASALRPMPAWHVLDLEACTAAAVDGQLALPVVMGDSSVADVLATVTHALRRGSASRITFLDRCFVEDFRRARLVAAGMLAAAPGLPWRCRVRADRFDPMTALLLNNCGCRHVLLASSRAAALPGGPPMDDPERGAIEAAVETARVLGLAVVVEFVIGRPGQSPAMLTAWQRWFADRGIEVRAQVRVVHSGSDGAGPSRLHEAAATAGCRDNDLTARDVTRLVRELTAPERVAAGHFGG